MDTRPPVFPRRASKRTKPVLAVFPTLQKRGFVVHGVAHTWQPSLKSAQTKFASLNFVSTPCDQVSSTIDHYRGGFLRGGRVDTIHYRDIDHYRGGFEGAGWGEGGGSVETSIEHYRPLSRGFFEEGQGRYHTLSRYRPLSRRI